MSVNYNLFNTYSSPIVKAWNQNCSTYTCLEEVKSYLKPLKSNWLYMLDSLIKRTNDIKSDKITNALNKGSKAKRLSDYDRIAEVFQTLKDPFGLSLKDRWLIYSAFISEDDSVQITFLNLKKRTLDQYGNFSYKTSFSYKNRLRCKFLTFLKKFKYFGLPERLLPVISDIWLNVYNDNFKIEYNVLSGDDIPKLYRKLNIPNNCMQSNPNNCLDFYAANPDVIKLLVGYKNSVPVSRALIWQVQKDKWYLDRNYTNGSGSIPRYMVCSKLDNNEPFKLKTNQGVFDIIDIIRHDCITPGSKSGAYYSVDVTTGYSSRIPYMDSFQYASGQYSNITLSTNQCDYDFQCDSTDGVHTDPNQNNSGKVYDDIDDCWIDEEDSICLESGDRTHYQNTCETYNGWYLRNDCVELDVSYRHCDYELEEDVATCDISGKTVHGSMVVDLEYDNSSYTVYENLSDSDIFSHFGISRDEYRLDKDNDEWTIVELVSELEEVQ